MSEKQLTLFNNIKTLKYDIQSLASYVQNDFTLMLSDGYVTQMGVAETIPSMERDFDRVIQQLEQYKTEVREMMEQFTD